MKFFHISDLHIGLRLYNRDLGEDQKYVFEQIAQAATLERPDAVVIAGDIYDKAIPSAEATQLFDQFISMLTEAVPQAEIMMISGNHDSPRRLNVFRSVLQTHRIHMIGIPPALPEEHIEKVTLTDSWGPVNFYLLPFIKPSMVREITGIHEDGSGLSYEEAVTQIINREHVDESQRNVLVSHQFYLPAGKEYGEVERMDSEIPTVGGIDSVSAQVLCQFDYAALGHIHKPMKVGSEFYRYSGTPMPYSVSEAGQKKGIIVVDLGRKGSISTSVIPLTPLHEIRKLEGNWEEVLKMACSDYVTVTLTDKVELDALDLQDRLRCAFPNLLEIRRNTFRPDGTARLDRPGEIPDPLQLCCDFLGDADEDEKTLLRELLNAVQEVQP